MKKLLFALTVVSMTALFPSCDPDTPDPKPDTGDTSQSTKNYLAKTVYTTGTSVGTTTYRYDAQNKLIWFANTTTPATIAQDTSELTRSAQGVINKITYRSRIYNNRKDSVDDRAVLQDVYYDAAATKYTHKIVQYTALKAPFKDSITYTHDAQNRITKESLYYYDFSKKIYVLYGATDFVYTATGDVTSKKTIFNNINGTTNNYEFSFTYTYDDKQNVLNLGNEAIVLGMGENWSSHNPLTIKSVFPGADAQYNQSLTYVYKYNTANRPLTAEVTDAIGGSKTTIVYTYQ